MEAMSRSFFQNLYTRDEQIFPELVTEVVQQQVDEQMNNDLCAPFTEKEIGDALFQIGPLKAPGPDGFPTCFLQRNWGLFQDDVVRAVQRFFCYW
jgi:hypothetical protein